MQQYDGASNDELIASALPPAQAPPQWMEEGSGPDIDVMDYLRLLWARRWMVLAIFAVTLILSSAWSLTRPKRYRATTRIVVEPSAAINNNQFDAFVNYWQLDRYISDQVEILRTRRLANRVVSKLGLASHPDYQGVTPGPWIILGGLGIQSINGSNIIELSLAGSDPQQVSEWLNVFVEEYIATNIEDGIEKTRKIYQVIQTRLDPLRHQVETAEQNLMRFREDQGSIHFATEQKNVITEQVSTLTSEYAKAKAERISLETKINALRRLRSTQVSEVAFPEVMQDSTISGLLQQRNSADLELQDKLGTYREGHPEIKELRGRVTGIDSAIQQQIENISEGLETRFSIIQDRERSLFANIGALREETISLSKRNMEYDRLEEAYLQNKRFLEEMLARSNEADMSASSYMNNIRVIEPASPPSGHYTPNISKTIVLGSALGLLLAVGLVFGLDFLDHTLRTPEQVEKYVGLDVLAALPKLSEDNSQALRESFQTLRTALLLAARGKKCQVLLVTSSVPSEGKTTVSFNLGKILAAGGARVLLIDADLRKPRIHRMLQVKNSRGLTSIVLGENKLEDVLHPVPDLPGLKVLTSGPLPTNPPELFGKGSFKELIDRAREEHDWIIIDTPPIASVTDPVVAGQVVDMALVVIRYGGARRQVIVNAMRTFARSGTRIAGVLLNSVDVERDIYYSAYYYSYFHYGYDDKREKTSSTRKRAAS